MAGYRHPLGVSPEQAAQFDEIRTKVWRQHDYHDRLPERGLIVDGRPALTGTDPALIGKYVIVTVRDPLGGEHDEPHGLRLARRFGPAERVGGTGLFQIYTADAGEAKVSVVATGSGCPELELAMVELLEHSDAEVYLYFGTSAGLHPYAAPGTVVISSGVVREDGMTRAYVDPGYPAAPSYEVITALVGGAEAAGAHYRVGLTRSTDSDLLGNGRPAVAGYMQPRHAEAIDYWVRAGVLTNDREASAVVTLGNLMNRRTGAVVGITDNYPMGQTITVGAGMADAAETLVNGVRELIRMDALKAERGREHWSPGLVDR